MDEEGRIVHFRYVASPEEVYETTQDETGNYLSERIVIPITSSVVSVGGAVITTLTAAIEGTGERDLLANMIMQVFQWDIDFSRDTRPGDTFRGLAEKVLIDGEFLRYDRILAVEYNSGQNTLRSFVFTDETGQNRYYFSDGTAVQRRFLKAPLNYRRISSTFSVRRFHPILRVYSPHYGVDYAAMTGTPVWAIGNGHVDFAGERGDNGIMVVLEHAGHYESSYSHLSGVASGISRGGQVLQGDIIGYVGNTGMSTGPHLHFGTKYRGDHIDPLAIDSPRAESLTGTQLALFEQQVAEWIEQLSAISLVPVDLTIFPAQQEEEAFEDLPSDFGIVEFETE
jgi:murein DD-endopeptidase MepM/ murein hydrolase activator NlpD